MNKVEDRPSLTVWHLLTDSGADCWLIHKKPEPFRQDPKQSQDYIINAATSPPRTLTITPLALTHLKEAFAALRLRTSTSPPSEWR